MANSFWMLSMSKTLYQVLPIRTTRWCAVAFPISQRGKWEYREALYFTWVSNHCKQYFQDLKLSGLTPESVSLNIVVSHFALSCSPHLTPNILIFLFCRLLFASSPKHWRFSEFRHFSYSSSPMYVILEQSHLHCILVDTPQNLVLASFLGSLFQLSM